MTNIWEEYQKQIMKRIKNPKEYEKLQKKLAKITVIEEKSEG